MSKKTKPVLVTIRFMSPKTNDLVFLMWHHIKWRLNNMNEKTLHSIFDALYFLLRNSSHAANNFKLLLKKRNKCSKRRKRWFWNLMYPISWSICNIPQRLVKTCNILVLPERPLDISLIFNQRCVYNANDIPTRFLADKGFKICLLISISFMAKQYSSLILSNDIIIVSRHLLCSWIYLTNWKLCS